MTRHFPQCRSYEERETIFIKVFTLIFHLQTLVKDGKVLSFIYYRKKEEFFFPVCMYTFSFYGMFCFASSTTGRRKVFFYIIISLCHRKFSSSPPPSPTQSWVKLITFCCQGVICIKLKWNFHVSCYCSLLSLSISLSL